MQLQDVMTAEVEVIAPEASLSEAAETMSHRDIGPLPVCEGERLVGMLTDRDITVRAVVAGRDPLTTRVRDVMTPDVVYGFEDQDVEDAARLMEQYQIRRLPVSTAANSWSAWSPWAIWPCRPGPGRWRLKCWNGSQSRGYQGGNSQMPPVLVVKSQAADIVEVIV